MHQCHWDETDHGAASLIILVVTRRKFRWKGFLGRTLQLAHKNKTEGKKRPNALSNGPFVPWACRINN